MQKEFRTIHLFAGAGGGILADLILGHTPVVAVEWEPYPCQVLRERVTAGWFPGMHVYEGDVRMFDSSKYKGSVDCIHAGFPCQDISNAGNQAGVEHGTRSGLYREVLRIADEVRPEYIFLENVSAIVNGNDGAMLRTVIGDLAERGFDAVWYNLSAAEIGAAHKRNRWWLLGYPKHAGQHAQCDTATSCEDVSDSPCQQCNGSRVDGENCTTQTSELGSHDCQANVSYPDSESPERLPCGEKAQHTEYGSTCEHVSNACAVNAQREQPQVSDQEEREEQGDGQTGPQCDGNGRRQAEPDMGGMADDVAWQLDVNDWVQTEAQVGRTTEETENRANRLKALGNGQVPLQAAAAFSILWEMMEAVREKYEEREC